MVNLFSLFSNSKFLTFFPLRLDKYIADTHGYTRNRAQFFIEQDLVFVNDSIVTKASYKVLATDMIRILDDIRTEFVSRSAIKLDSFLWEIGLDVKGMDCLDIGASTGGFTQVLLMRGARSVQTVDVGTLQLHPSIRSDARVTCLENTDIRDFKTAKRYDCIVGDVSFISLTKLINTIYHLADEKTEIVLLYKPQFEVGPEHVDKSGVVRDEKRIARKLKEFGDLLVEMEMRVKKLSPSAIDGEAGNREHLIWIQKKES